MSTTCATQPLVLLALLPLIHLLLCTLAYCDQLSLEVLPNKYHALTQDNPTISCSLSGNEEDTANYQLYWTGPDTLNNSEALASKHQLVNKDSTLLELTLTSFEPEQAGTYTCLAKPKSPQLPTLNQTIELYQELEPAVGRCPEKQNFVAGSTGKIVCSFNLKHKLFIVELYKGDRKAGSRYKYDAASESFLIDGLVNSTDDGQYYINARYKVKPGKSIRQNITVIVSQPTTPPRPSSVAGNPGQALSLQDPAVTPYIIGGALICLVILVLLDLMCCVCFDIGVSYSIRSKCCLHKATSVITDKITSDTT